MSLDFSLLQDDTDKILDDWAESYTIKRTTPTYDDKGLPTANESTVETFVGDKQPYRGNTKNIPVALQEMIDNVIYCREDIAVVEDDLIYDSEGVFEYVVFMKRYEDHYEVYTRKSDGAEVR